MDVVVFLAMPICCWTPSCWSLGWKSWQITSILKKWLKLETNKYNLKSCQHCSIALFGATILVGNSLILNLILLPLGRWTWSLPSSRNRHGPGQFQGSCLGETHGDHPAFSSSLRDPLSIWAQAQKLMSWNTGYDQFCCPCSARILSQSHIESQWCFKINCILWRTSVVDLVPWSQSLNSVSFRELESAFEWCEKAVGFLGVSWSFKAHFW